LQVVEAGVAQAVETTVAVVVLEDTELPPELAAVAHWLNQPLALLLALHTLLLLVQVAQLM